MTATVTAAALSATACFMAKKDVRYYLNGMLVTAGVDGDVTLVATDGRALLATRVSGVKWVGAPVIVPRDLVELAVKAGGDVELAADGDTVMLTAGGRTFSGKAIDGRFPDWRAVLNRADETTPEAYAPGVLEMIVKAGKAVAKCNGRRTGAVTLAPAAARAGRFAVEIAGCQTFGAVMPMRDSVADLGAAVDAVAGPL